MAAEKQDGAGTGEDPGDAVSLLHSLMPEAERFFYYDRSQACTWSSAAAEDPEVDLAISNLGPGEFAKSAAAVGVMRTLPSGRRLLLFPVKVPGDPDPCMLAALMRESPPGSAMPEPRQATALGPVAQLFGEHLRLQQLLGQERSRVKEAEQELKLAYRVDEKIHGTMRGHASLAELVGQSGRFLGIAYSVLLLPSKRIRVSATHSSWKDVNRRALDKYLVNTLFPRVRSQHSPVVFEVPAAAHPADLADRGYQAMVCPVTDRLGNVEGIVAQLGRITGEPFESSHARFMAHIVRKAEYVIEQFFDPMTGLMNRVGFEAQLEESRKSLSTEPEPHQIIYFDLDNVQLINDTFDHEAGDEVIRRFAHILNERLPKNGVATRLTSDDFAILLTHSDLDAAMDLGACILEDSRKLHYLRGDKSLQATVSIGIAVFDADAASGEGDPLTAARIACQSAKDHGRNRIEVYDQDDQSIVRRYDDMNLVAEIQKTLDSDGFELLAQPIAALQGNGRPRYEILLRMKGSDGGRISSTSFFSAAERYQLMPQIDRWVVSTAVRMLVKEAGRLEAASASFAVNLSGQSLGDDRILEFVTREIDSAGLPAEILSFELTESAAVTNHRKAQAFIEVLRRRGCRFSLDDFGAGLSSFAYLKSFKVDTLKIDGSFIRDIITNRTSEAMVAAITQVAKVMKLETVAEYVESAEIRDFVTRLGVDCAQGHAVGKPLPLDQVLASLRKSGAELAESTA